MQRPSYADLLRARLGRREFLAALGASTVPLALPAWLAPTPRFEALDPSTADDVRVPDGYVAETLLAWGDPLFPDAPTFDPARLSATSQRRQFGFNADFVAFMPFSRGSSAHGILCVNHEYTLRNVMFPGRSGEAATAEEVDIAKAAQGMSFVAVHRDETGRWHVDRADARNRRIHGETPMRLSGPAAGSKLLRTQAEPTGTRVHGTLGNCGGGKTLWGTVLTAEENINEYFGRAGDIEDERLRNDHLRFGAGREVSLRGWEQADPRFDLTREPHEAYRFGWVVELDPFDPRSTPVKRTALGRFKHESATCALAQDGRVVVYSGDDERFQFLYKFVSERRFVPGGENQDLLDTGTLFVAALEEDGSGQWLPLRPEGALRDWSQADILVRAREAAALLGATPMDRPEDIELHPVNQRVYVAMTNNSERTAASPGNPRTRNLHGHVLEIDEARGDLAALEFTWTPLLLGGDQEHDGGFYGGHRLGPDEHLSCPDNLAFDSAGTLWVATDGQPKTLGTNDALYAVATTGMERGRPRRFLTGPVGAEITGPELTPDDRSLFISMQHPERWPDHGGTPRAAVVVVRKLDLGRIGT
ncbi:MAG: PhoX family phosphatase [Planctomycetota bacterium]